MPPCPETTCVTPSGHPKSHDLGAVTYSVGTPPLLFGNPQRAADHVFDNTHAVPESRCSSQTEKPADRTKEVSAESSLIGITCMCGWG
jgi:hypothetical protein